MSLAAARPRSGRLPEAGTPRFAWPLDVGKLLGLAVGSSLDDLAECLGTAANDPSRTLALG